jgi:ribosome-associated toxin RatA of RatAB toxin-antitoxin module
MRSVLLRYPLPGLICAAAASLALAAEPAVAPEIRFSAEGQGEFVIVSASVELSVERRIAWEVLSDYDHYAEFIPDMRLSRVIWRSEDGMVVEQKGEVGFLIFRQTLDVTTAVIETPQRRIVSRLLTGNLKDMSGTYELFDAPGGVQLVHTGRFVPDFILPPFVGIIAVRQALERQFTAMVREIIRRGENSRAPSSDGLRSAQ